ncbi:MAG: sigma 54-interacting transcriptional regulator [Candidatus Hydrogenedentota bacterium]
MDDILKAVVSNLAQAPETALARIWLVRPGDQCSVCAYEPQCPSHERCLHLVASDGASLDPNEPRWDKLDGRFRRFPINTDRIGRIVALGEVINESRLGGNRSHFLDPEWADHEGIAAFSGLPLIFHGEVLGALCLFSREQFTDLEMDLLRIFANHAAASIANARAFESIQALSESLRIENEYLREEIGGGAHIIGESPAIQSVLRQIDAAARSDVSVVVTGESGTGKELVAQAIHARSSRATRPLVKVNCASIPAHLFESEFFGHVRGAFTGAVRNRTGRFALADKGTLFLDEIAEIPLDLQAKLLRVLQEGTFEPIGDDRTRSVDVRVIAATNRDLRSAIKADRFREDLYYRLNVFPIHVPPLRDRRGDIPILVRNAVERAERRHGLEARLISEDELQRLCLYDWPGNVRELENIVERGVLTSGAGALRFDVGGPATSAPTLSATGDTAARPQCASYEEIQAAEAAMIREALARSGGKIAGKSGAAARLNVKPSTLAYRMNKLGVHRP